MIPTIKEDAPPGYLFLCPKEAFETGPLLSKWPDCPAYWSLDPSGVERLSTKDATHLGFPPCQLTTKVSGWSWDDSVYAGLRQFHQGKGFDPDSQDVALHLGHPLYQVSSGRDPLFAHCDEEDSSTEADDNSETASEEDVESGEEFEEQMSVHDGHEQVNELTTLHDEDQDVNVHDGYGEADERTSTHDDDSAISQVSNFIMNVQLLLVLFVILCSVYDAF
ncbi:hypothetical protein B0H16DRAFT_544873 [Mycena metata]|uniref:Uncharacterized protein n=1 Tax=Mycena metata TaxID=1033252 RepID=A0AAD7H638_9AGAR|nr:hypothetical protein B0H16DRAFT_544873 [Mycena metata]